MLGIYKNDVYEMLVYIVGKGPTKEKQCSKNNNGIYACGMDPG